MGVSLRLALGEEPGDLLGEPGCLAGDWPAAVEAEFTVVVMLAVFAESIICFL